MTETMTDAMYTKAYFINAMIDNEGPIADNRYLSELIFDLSDEDLAEAVTEWCYIDFGKAGAEDWRIQQAAEITFDHIMITVKGDFSYSG